MRTHDRLLRAYRKLHEIEIVEPQRRTFRQRLYYRLKAQWFARTASARFGADIHLGATIGQGVKFGHGLHGVFIAQGVVIGDGCDIYHHVTLGGTGGKHAGAPHLGRDVLIGANATIIGPCVIGDGARIGAGVTLVNAIVEPGAVVVNRSAFDLTNGRFVHRQ